MTQFLDIVIDYTLSWKNHINKLMDKLRKVCYAINIVHIMKHNNLMSVSNST